MHSLAEEKIYQIFEFQRCSASLRWKLSRLCAQGMFSQQGSQFATNYMQEYALNNNMRRIKNQLESFLNDTITLCVELSESVLETEGLDVKRTKMDGREIYKGRLGSRNSPEPKKEDKNSVPDVAKGSERTLLSTQ